MELGPGNFSDSSAATVLAIAKEAKLLQNFCVSNVELIVVNYNAMVTWEVNIYIFSIL